MEKVLIQVKGGVVQSVVTSKDMRVILVDYDNLDSGDQVADLDLYPNDIEEDMYTLFTDQTDPMEMEIRDQLKYLKF